MFRRSGPARGAARRWKTATCLFVLLAVGLVASSCGGSPSNPATSPTTDPHSTSSAATPTTLSATATAVLAAYRAESNAFEQALADANAADPALAATMVDTQLQGVKANLLADQRQGIVGRGTVTLHPKVGSASSSGHCTAAAAYRPAGLSYPRLRRRWPLMIEAA